MQVFGAIAARPLLRSVALGRLTTALHQGLFRSAPHRPGERDPAAARACGWSARIRSCFNPLAFAGASGASSTSPPDAGKVGEGTPRLPGGPHRGPDRGQPARHGPPGLARRRCRRELLRAAVFADSVAEPNDVLVLAGDFNVIRECSTTLPQLGGVGLLEADLLDRPACSSAAPGSRACAAVGPTARRREHGRLLSDHAPVEVTIE